MFTTFLLLTLSRRQLISRSVALTMSSLPRITNADESIYFYSSVTPETCLQLRQALGQFETQTIASSSYYNADVRPAQVCVHSPGGSLLSGLYMYDYIKSMKIPVHTHVEGLVASAATLLTVGGKHRTMSRHSMMLFHQASLPIREDLLPYSELRDNTVNLHKCMDALIDIYSETSKLDKDSVKQLLGNEQFLTAQECMQCGFIDEITG